MEEQERLAAVRRYDILDTPPDGAFDRITAIAARLMDVPIAIVSIVDHDRIWFKSHHGLDVEQIGRDPGLCASCILQGGPWIVNDARRDPRTLANPLVAGEFGLQFYFGVPLRTHDGFNLGTLCVLDFAPRDVTPAEIAHLTDLGAVVMGELELRLSARNSLTAYQGELARRELREDHISGLNRELAHRSKNLLAIVQAIVRQTSSNSGSVPDYAGRLLARIAGLAHTHDLISDRDWHGATLSELASRQLAPFTDSGKRIELEGPPLILTPVAAQNIGLALHELAANAVKYGALSVPDGKVVFAWTVTPEKPELLRACWKEENCPLGDRSHHGFGLLVLERIAPASLDGTAKLSFEPRCLSWELEVPLTYVLADEGVDDKLEAIGPAHLRRATTLRPRKPSLSRIAASLHRQLARAGREFLLAFLPGRVRRHSH